MSSDSESDNSQMEEAAVSVSVDAVLQNDDPDTLRIMLSTDNHLGYAERDNIRGMDSFAAFEEVLYTAKRFHCDMVLIAGDLFHDNRPSRRTLHKTMEILRRYCMGPEAVKIELLSDNATHQFRSTVASSGGSGGGGAANYQDPNYAVDLPVFSIHGNHDDPSRDQGGGELLAALDLLAVCNLVNYFGRQEEVDKVEISPILLKKGDTKVALYGLGSMRDERLNRMWERQKVSFLRPDDDEDDQGGYFNIFAIHQNRDLGRGTKNCVQESFLPEWMDIVVWGHEHECLIEFFESVVGTFRITQPGSSVATSLVSGEAARKKVGILDIKGKNFRLHPVPLTQVRSFVTTELSLREHRAELDPEDPKVDGKVTKVLEEEVQLMVLNARDKMKEVLRDARAAGSNAGDTDSPLKYKLQGPEEVLVRIRVEHNGFSTLNNQRFGAKFVGSVANPSEILLFHRKKDPKLTSTIKKQNIQPLAPEELERSNMEDLIREQLAVPESKLKIFGEKDLSEALEDYVDKSVTAAIADVATDLLDQTQKKLIKGSHGKDKIEMEAQVIDKLEREALQEVVSSDKASQPTRESRKKRKLSVEALPSSEGENSMVDDDDSESPQPPARKRGEAKAASSNLGRSAALDNSSDEDVVVSEKPAQKAKARPAERPKRGATKQKVVYALDESDGDDNFESDDIVDDDDDEDDDEPLTKPPPSKRVRGKTKAAPTLKTTTSGTARKRTVSKPSRRNDFDDNDDGAPMRKTTTSGNLGKKAGSKPSRRNNFDDSDDDVQYVGESADLDIDWGSAATKTQRSEWL